MKVTATQLKDILDNLPKRNVNLAHHYRGRYRVAVLPDTVLTSVEVSPPKVPADTIDFVWDTNKMDWVLEIR